jgi:plastocyanin
VYSIASRPSDGRAGLHPTTEPERVDLVVHRTGINARSLALLVFGMAVVLLILLPAASRSRSALLTAHTATAPTSAAAHIERLGLNGASDPAASPTAAAQNQITIQDFSFAPGALTVSAGTTITWVNGDSVTHTVTAADGSFDSSNLMPGQQFSFTFTTPGTYHYHCSIHPFMTGQVVVQ